MALAHLWDTIGKGLGYWMDQGEVVNRVHIINKYILF